jgi:phosphoglycerate kinase
VDKLSVRDLDAAGKRVFVRVDFNVPIEDGRVTDDSRIRAALPTIGLLLQKGAAVIVASHLGRPNGRVVDGFRLRPVAERLSQLLGRYVPITGDALGPGTLDAVQRLKPGQVLMLENLRFHAEEEANDPKFARTLASYAEAYVNDAFGTAHRAHASTVGITEYLPAYAGLLMEREIEMLSKLLESPDKPFAAVLGGAKVSGKINVLDSLMERVDMFVVGGGMANTFLAAQGFTVGKSLLEKDRIEDARRVLGAAEKRHIPVVLPVDVVVAKEVTRGAERKIVSAKKIPNSWSAVDIGPASIRAFDEALTPSKTVFWNGPLGVFEVPTFGDGTRAVARFLAERAEAGVTVVIGGGDSVAAVEQLGLGAKMTHMSTGGGAGLEFLEKGDLPGITALLDREAKGSPEAEPRALEEPARAVVTPPLYPDLPPPVRPALRPLVPVGPGLGLQGGLEAAAPERPFGLGVATLERRPQPAPAAARAPDGRAAADRDKAAA